MARYFGTDKNELYNLYDSLQEASDASTVSIIYNQKSNWMGEVFLASSDNSDVALNVPQGDRNEL